MGIKHCVLKTVKVLAFVVFVVLVAPGVPPHTKFETYSIEPPLELKGKLSPNAILDKAEAVQLDREICGPESIAIRGDELYTGLHGGEVIKVKNGKVTTIAKFGKECEGDWDVLNCGRPAGLRFDSKGKLLVIDAAYGIFRVDVDTGATEHLVNMATPVEGKLPKFPDDLDVDSEGLIYWSDASTAASVDRMIFEFLGQPSARLIQYNPKTKKSAVLIDDLHFSNGVQLSKNEDFVMVSEMVRSRIWRYFLKGERKGEKEIFVDRLPGLPDNIRPNGKDGYYITLASPLRTPNKPGIIDSLAPWPLVRKFMARTLYLITSLCSFIDKLFPNIYIRQLRFYVSHLGPLGDLKNQPKEVIIVEIDGNGNIIGSLHNQNGPVASSSEIRVGKDFAYIGSPSANNIYRIKTADLHR